MEKFFLKAKELADMAADQACLHLMAQKEEFKVKALAGDKEAEVHIKTIDHLLATCPKKEAP
jgi:hypothetical protein